MRTDVARKINEDIAKLTVAISSEISIFIIHHTEKKEF